MTDTTPLLTASRDALAKALCDRMEGKPWEGVSDWRRNFWRQEADGLLATGVVRAADELAQDLVFVNGMAQAATELSLEDMSLADVMARREVAAHQLRALAAALDPR